MNVTEYLCEGENALAVLVWHFGHNLQRYILAKAGLIFEVSQDGEIIAASDENTLSRKSLTYKSGYEKMLTPQLGYSFFYDATKEDEWKKNGNAEYVGSNLKLISQDRRTDDLLAVCYPCGVDMTTPSFSLYYYTAVREYLEYTGGCVACK